MVPETDLRESNPRQDQREEQKRRRDDFRRARTGSGRDLRLRLVMRGMNRCMFAVRRGRAMRMFRDMAGGMILDAGERRSTRMPCTRADERDQPRQNSAEQRQKYDRLIHPAVSPSSD